AERILPHGMAEIVWNLSAPQRFRTGNDCVVVPGAALIAARDEVYHVDTSAPAHLFGLVFQPAAVTSLLGIGLAELTGGIFALGDFAQGAAFETRVREARSACQRRHRALTFFAELPTLAMDREAALLLSAWRDGTGRTRSVRSVREELGLSSPTFVSRIRDQLGLRPAQLRQLLMFRDAVTALATAAQ